MIRTIQLALLFFSLTVVNTTYAKKPNLLIIQTDEHNFRTLSSYRTHMSVEQGEIWGKGVVVNTPNIDKLAIEGAISLNYYASSPVCTPSRASFMTGLYPRATGAHKNNLKLNGKLPTFAKILRNEGYSTSYLGKWHLNGKDEKYQFGIKDNAGFTDNRFMMTAGHNPYFHITKQGITGINQKKADKLPKNEVIHLTDYFTNKALNILERDKHKPFAMMISFPDPHTPDYARPPYHTMYEHLQPQPPKTMAKQLLAKRPEWASKGKTDKNEAKAFKPEAVKQYFGMVKHIDDSVGQLLNFLDKNNLTDNTIVVFTSDHGDMYFEHNRTNKNVPYEASARIPFLVRYPSKIPAGKIVNKAFTTVDFTPTILGLMNVKSTANFHGINAANDYTSPTKIVTENRMTYFVPTSGSWVTAVDNRYKLVLHKNVEPWLFDLHKDPDEITNFYNVAAYKPIQTKMRIELARQLKANNEKSIRFEELKL